MRKEEDGEASEMEVKVENVRMEGGVSKGKRSHFILVMLLSWERGGRGGRMNKGQG